MALDMTAEQRKLGETNFQRVADGLTRRDFMKSMALTAGVVAPVSAAVYFGYQATLGHPVKAALIGAGDEGGVLVGEHNPEFVRFLAVCDIRPTNMERIFVGEHGSSPRKGFNRIYGAEAKGIKKYTNYLDMLHQEKDIEMVVIALPLHLHAPVAIDCMIAGKKRGKPIHVLCEKLMAWNVADCKRMIDVAKKTYSILAIGHQRHYSLLYAHALEVMQSGVLGDVRHIRALWHRNNSWPWKPPTKGKPLVSSDVAREPKYRDGWYPPVYQEDYEALKAPGKLKEYGFEGTKDVTPMEQLVRWRLFQETGGGLMAELGSHQLDACSIFLGKVRPLSVSGFGGKLFYRPGANDREVDDSVFVTYEFPGPNHPKGKNHGSDNEDLVVVTYSSLNTNGFERYGECVMGSRGSLVVETEQSAQLYVEPEPGKPSAGSRATNVSVSATGPGKPALESEASPGGALPVAAVGPGAAAGATGPVSRGYREEIEDFAYCVRLWDAKLSYEKDAAGHYKQRLPRCHGEIAMADAVIALSANKAMRSPQRVKFESDWFEAEKITAGPDDPNAQPKVKPKLSL